jgi:two-component system OmpR family response regulator
VVETKVLLVENNRAEREALGAYLTQYGFDVRHLESAKALTEELCNRPPDVVVLDQFTQHSDAFVRLPELRTAFGGQIMVLTANDCEIDRVLSLESGADEFLVKGISFREIVARLRVLARYRHSSRAGSAETDTPADSGDAGWSVDPIRRQVVSPAGIMIELTGLEFETFFRLYSMRGKVVSRDELALHVLKRPLIIAGRSLENLLSRIRVKLLPHAGGVALIKAIRGRGYIFIGFG